jgi:hypothetical protein
LVDGNTCYQIDDQSKLEFGISVLNTNTEYQITKNEQVYSPKIKLRESLKTRFFINHRELRVHRENIFKGIIIFTPYSVPPRPARTIELIVDS